MTGSITLLRRAWLLFALLLLSTAVQAREAPRQARPDGAAIASAHALATDAGFEVLAQGGNAFDAAVAVSSTSVSYTHLDVYKRQRRRLSRCHRAW